MANGQVATATAADPATATRPAALEVNEATRTVSQQGNETNETKMLVPEGAPKNLRGNRLRPQQPQQQPPSQQSHHTQQQEQEQQEQKQKQLKTSSSPEPQMRSSTVTILHISDTHSLHHAVSSMPPADILIHSGDVSREGLDSEIGDFNHWLGQIKGNYKHIFVIPGNHDFWETNKAIGWGKISVDAARDPNYFQSKVSHAKVLHHELAKVMGLTIWGSGWNPKVGDSSPGNRYDDIPAGVDVLVTHEAPFGIFDMTFAGHWGYSQELLSAIYRIKPKVHLFGHVHEQRGHWEKNGDTFEGGVEYHPNPNSDQVFKPNGAPPSNYPVEVESNNAMANQATVDHAYTGIWRPQHIVGRPRLITATKKAENADDDHWHFSSKIV
eukprot:TRINITY_DN1727_c0_g1_i1.p1 TRINITY_DN1727_c0_g1~~TRINITY_DN1727_c0_g1_i1.p1  ORF type:complete len:425 (+),score=83.79 TRINITY_DN1727_c0_g1_i1:128-1276(+)